jgi:hypothetical protein
MFRPGQGQDIAKKGVEEIYTKIELVPSACNLLFCLTHQFVDRDRLGKTFRLYGASRLCIYLLRNQMKDCF